LIGPSGSGKSTLLNLIEWLDKTTSGDILVISNDLSKMGDNELSAYRNKTIGFTFQFFNLQPYLNVQENLETPLIFRGERSEERRKKSIQTL
jgi:putative ABC transport system ATP-binding protein